MAPEANQWKLIRLSGFTLLDHQLALHDLLTEPRGVCAIANPSCCFYINASGEVEQRANISLQQASWLHNFKNPTTQTIRDSIKGYLPSVTWFLPFLGTFVAIFCCYFLGLACLTYLLNLYPLHYNSSFPS